MTEPMNEPMNEVLICGAGIAGAATAYWLRRAGYQVTVVERAPRPRPGGQTVDLRGAGRTVMERMGLLDAAREIAVAQAGFELVGSDGRSLARMPVDAFDGQGIVSELEILRGDLAELLLHATRPDVSYVFDETVTGLEQDRDGVTVSFEKAAPRRFALVIGADGSHSVIRRLAFGPDRDALHPLHCYNAWFSVQDDLPGDRWYQMHNAPGGLVASVRPGHRLGEFKAGLSFRSDPIAYDRRDLAAQRALVRDRFAGVGWVVPQLLRGMDRADDFFLDSIDQVKLDRWDRGRVVLVGDAGYCPSPLTGMGTSLALVGGYVLAGELRRAGGDHRAALDRYGQILRPYVDQAQQLPPGGINGYAPRGRLEIRLRTASMRAMTRWPLNRLLAGQFSKADAITLPDYDFRPAAVRS